MFILLTECVERVESREERFADLGNVCPKGLSCVEAAEKSETYAELTSNRYDEQLHSSGVRREFDVTGDGQWPTNKPSVCGDSGSTC